MLRLLVCTWWWWWWWWWWWCWWWLWFSQSCPTIYSLSLVVCTRFNQPLQRKLFSQQQYLSDGRSCQLT
jgi:hypothetical protein